MEDLAVLLAQASRAFEAGDFNALLVSASKISEQAQHIGMTKLARVAGDAMALSTGKDTAALAAVTERLSRLGEKSLMAVWDLQENTV